jgi:hypothetical protein
MRRACIAAAALAVAASGCGGGDSAVSAASSKLGEIRSGELFLRLVVDPRGEAGEDPFGFELSGPFALAEEEGDLPVARIAYTQIANGQEGTATFISDGQNGYVESNGVAYELNDRDEDDLRAVGGESDDPLDGLDLDKWFVDPKERDSADGKRVTARVDVVNAANDLIELTNALRAEDLAAIEGDDARRLDEAVKSATLDLVTGNDDLLRRLKLVADIGFAVPERLREVLSSEVGSRFEFELRIEKPNEPVSVQAPANPRPASELP